MKIILASGSPRRRELIHMITDDFIVEVSDAKEILPDEIGAEQAAEYLAAVKAEAVYAHHVDDLVIGCDTVVIHDGTILGKPANRDDAKRMLQLLSGCTHKVKTGVSLIFDGKIHSFFQTTEVTFYSLTDEEIESYLDTGEPFDKAGAYGIQGKGSLLVKEIKGDYFNVVGLPVAELYRCMKSLGLNIKEN